MEKDKKGAAVKFPPPLIFLIGIALGYAIEFIRPSYIGDILLINYLGKLLLLLGISVLIISALGFFKAKTHIEPWKPTTTIISTGLFAYSRNPIYLAFCFLTIGIGIVFDSLWIIGSFIPSVILLYFIAIKKEEHYLETKFGDEYLNYKNKVRRWF